MVRVNHILTERQGLALRSLSRQTGCSASELLRRMVDYCAQERVLCELVPGLSGYLKVEGLCPAPGN